MLTFIENYLSEVSKICSLIDSNEVEKVANEIIKVRDENGRIFFIGVGGSAGNASHAVCDLRKLTDSDLNHLSNELRQETISIVSKTGGHLGSSLGVIELTIAIHSVFNTPFDKLIWDVSHQCYPHKILTGRRKGMMT